MRCWSSTPWWCAPAGPGARSQGCTVIRLDTYEGNEPAKAFYPKLGYRYAGATEFFFEGFIRENLVCFEKGLA